MTPMPPNVRFAKSSDEDEIMRLMRAAFKEQPIFPLNENKMREVIRKCTAEDMQNRRGMVAVIDGPDGLEGYLIAVFSQYWYTDAFHLEELSNFVHQDHRRGKHHARNLIEFAKWFAEFCGVPLIMGILSTQRLEPKIRCYQRQMKLCGAVFTHNTGHVDGLLSERG
jgi:hypothetical protein